jgi:hypothetical protein
MTAFVFTDLVDMRAHYSACLGASAAAKLTDNDIGKPVKMGTVQNYVLCADNDEIEGFVGSISPATYNDGFAFGGVWKEGRIAVQATGAISIGGYVVAAAQAAIDTKAAGKVKAGTTTRHHWRMIRNITNPGAAAVVNDTILIERDC